MHKFIWSITACFLFFCTGANAQTTVTTLGLTIDHCVKSSGMYTVVDSAACPGRVKIEAPIMSAISLSNSDCGTVITPGNSANYVTVMMPSAP